MLDRGDPPVLRGDPELLERGRAVPGCKVLLVACEDATRRPAELHREERGDDRVLSDAALRAEAAAHVIAENADLRERQLDREVQALTHRERVLGRLPDGENVAVPRRHRAVRLERIVDLRRCAVRRVDDGVGLADRPPHVASLVRARFGDVAVALEPRRDVADRLLEVDDMRKQLVVDLDEGKGLGGGVLVIGRDGSDLVADEAHLLSEDRVLRAEGGLWRVESVEHAADAGQSFGLLRLDLANASARIRTAEHADEEHAREIDVLRVASAARHALHAVDAAAFVTDLGPLSAQQRKVAPLDEDERFVDLALELLAALDDPRHYRFRRPAETPAATMP